MVLFGNFSLFIFYHSISPISSEIPQLLKLHSFFFGDDLNGIALRMEYYS